MADSVRSRVGFLARAGLLLAAYRVAQLLIMGPGHPDESVYTTSFLPAAVFREPEMIAAGVLLAAPTLLGAGRLSWDRLDPHRDMRVLALGCAAIVAWTALLLPYNAYLGSAYIGARVLLAACLILAVRWPVFLVPGSLLLVLLLGQLNVGVVDGHWHWLDKRLPLDLLILFVAYTWLALFVRPRSDILLYCALILVGVHYWSAAFEKLTIGPRPWSWILDNPLTNLIVSAYHSAGWLRPLGEEGVVRLANALRSFAPLANLATVLIEAAGVLLLADRRLSRWILAGFIALHVGIVAFSGILFWQWIAVDAILIVVLAKGARRAAAPGDSPFGGVRAAAAAFVIAIGPWLFATINFGWFDSRVTNTFTLRATGASGREYTIEGRFFAPYDIVMTQRTFGFLVDGPILGGTFGSSPSHAATVALERAGAGDVRALRDRFGTVESDGAREERFRRFVERTTLERTSRGRPSVPLRLLAPPFHFQRFRDADAYDFAEPLHHMAVIHEERFFDGRAVHVTVRDTVAEIPLSPSEGGRR